MRYLDTLFPRLAASGLELEMFYEVKANLRHDAAAADARGGVQPDPARHRELQQRGAAADGQGRAPASRTSSCCAGARNSASTCAWNMLAGFPGESPAGVRADGGADPAAHASAAAVLAARRSGSTGSARSTRDADSSASATSVRLAGLLLRVPARPRELARIAYYFDFDYDDGRAPEQYLQPVQRAVLAWWRGRRAR